MTQASKNVSVKSTLGAIGRNMKYTWMILTVCFYFGSKSSNEVRASDSKSQTPQLSDILREEFGHGSGLHNLTMSFSESGEYDLNYGSEGWYWRNQGKYALNANSITLTSNKCEFWQKPDKGCTQTFKSGKCDLREQVADIEFLYELRCEFDRKFSMFTSDSKPSNVMSFDIKKYKVPPGTARKFESHEVIVLGNVSGTVTTPVVLREGPGTNFKKLDYIVNAYDGPRLPSVPKGKVMTVHARTVNKQKVQNWENYWLLVSIDDSHKAWAFGEFIKY